MTLHRVAGENFNLLFSIGLTGYGAGMVLLPLLAELLREAYGWRGGLLIISALMAHIIPVGMAIKLELDESSTQRNGFQSVPSSPEGEECNTSTSQDITGEFNRKILLERQCRSRGPSTGPKRPVCRSCGYLVSSAFNHVDSLLEDSIDLRTLSVSWALSLVCSGRDWLVYEDWYKL